MSSTAQRRVLDRAQMLTKIKQEAGTKMDARRKALEVLFERERARKIEENKKQMEKEAFLERRREEQETKNEWERIVKELEEEQREAQLHLDHLRRLQREAQEHAERAEERKRLSDLILLNKKVLRERILAAAVEEEERVHTATSSHSGGGGGLSRFLLDKVIGHATRQTNSRDGKSVVSVSSRVAQDREAYQERVLSAKSREEELLTQRLEEREKREKQREEQEKHIQLELAEKEKKLKEAHFLKLEWEKAMHELELEQEEAQLNYQRLQRLRADADEKVRVAEERQRTANLVLQNKHLLRDRIFINRKKLEEDEAKLERVSVERQKHRDAAAQMVEEEMHLVREARSRQSRQARREREHQRKVEKSLELQNELEVSKEEAARQEELRKAKTEEIRRTLASAAEKAKQELLNKKRSSANSSRMSMKTEQDSEHGSGYDTADSQNIEREHKIIEAEQKHAAKIQNLEWFKKKVIEEEIIKAEEDRKLREERILQQQQEGTQQRQMMIASIHKHQEANAKNKEIYRQRLASAASMREAEKQAEIERARAALEAEESAKRAKIEKVKVERHISSRGSSSSRGSTPTRASQSPPRRVSSRGVESVDSRATSRAHTPSAKELREALEAQHRQNSATRLRNIEMYHRRVSEGKQMKEQEEEDLQQRKIEDEQQSALVERQRRMSQSRLSRERQLRNREAYRNSLASQHRERYEEDLEELEQGRRMAEEAEVLRRKKVEEFRQELLIKLRSGAHSKKTLQQHPQAAQGEEDTTTTTSSTIPAIQEEVLRRAQERERLLAEIEEKHISRLKNLEVFHNKLQEKEQERLAEEQKTIEMKKMAHKIAEDNRRARLEQAQKVRDFQVKNREAYRAALKSSASMRVASQEEELEIAKEHAQAEAERRKKRIEEFRRELMSNAGRRATSSHSDPHASTLPPVSQQYPSTSDVPTLPPDPFSSSTPHTPSVSHAHMAIRAEVDNRIAQRIKNIEVLQQKIALAEAAKEEDTRRREALQRQALEEAEEERKAKFAEQQRQQVERAKNMEKHRMKVAIQQVGKALESDMFYEMLKRHEEEMQKLTLHPKPPHNRRGGGGGGAGRKDPRRRSGMDVYGSSSVASSNHHNENASAFVVVPQGKDSVDSL
eukprot:PhF_6_TR26222/c1_g1_i1/m.37396